MTDLVDRGRSVHRWALEDRCDRRRRRSLEWLYAGLLVCFSLGFLLLGLKAGLYLEPYHVPGEVSLSSDLDAVNVSGGGDRVRIDGYEFVFQSEKSSRFSGDTIGQVNYFEPDRIYIQKGLGVEDTYSTCVHERMHLLRLEKDSEEMHEWIYEYQDVIPDSTCFELVRSRFGVGSVVEVRRFVESGFESKLSLEIGAKLYK